MISAEGDDQIFERCSPISRKAKTVETDSNGMLCALKASIRECKNDT